MSDSELLPITVLTGCGGFLGGNLLKDFILSGYCKYNRILAIYNKQNPGLTHINVKYAQCNLLRRTWLKQLLEKQEGIHACVHLAGASSPKAKGFLENNVIATQNLIDSLPGGTRFIYSSSSTVYGNRSYELDGTPASELWIPTPNSLYGATKVACEALVSAATALGQIRGVNLRFPAIVGPGMTHGLLPDIIHKVRNNKQIRLLGEHPGSIKPFLWVGDAIRFIKEFLTNDERGAFNVCPKDNLSCYGVADIVANHRHKYGRKIIFKGANSTFPGDNPLVIMDNGKLAAFLKEGEALPMSSADAVSRTMWEIGQESI